MKIKLDFRQCVPLKVSSVIRSTKEEWKSFNFSTGKSVLQLLFPDKYEQSRVLISEEPISLENLFLFLWVVRHTGPQIRWIGREETGRTKFYLFYLVSFDSK